MVVWLVLVSIIVNKLAGKFFFASSRIAHVINIDYSAAGKFKHPRLLIFRSTALLCCLVSFCQALSNLVPSAIIDLSCQDSTLHF
jgi:hypothetical protein